ncbi:hypothetical protein Hanom_Chr04g00313341 [Helianthus anomalus]
MILFLVFFFKGRREDGKWKTYTLWGPQNATKINRPAVIKSCSAHLPGVFKYTPLKKRCIQIHKSLLNLFTNIIFLMINEYMETNIKNY